MDLHSQSLNVVRAVCSSGEIREVELDLIPAFIQSHGHSTDEWLHSGCRLEARLDSMRGVKESYLIVGSSESSSDVLVVKDLNFESEVLL